MQIDSKESGSITILMISGEIDLYNAPQIKENVSNLMAQGKYRVVIDLGEVSYIDSSGIGALISSLSHLKRHQGGMKIANVNGAVRKVFELTKLSSFFDIFDSEAKAIAAFE